MVAFDLWPRPARMPRKILRRFARSAVVAVVVFAGLLCLIRVHHFAPAALQMRSRRPLIEAKRSVAALRRMPPNLYYMTTEDVLYCYIPKNACSRFKQLLRMREGFSDWDNRAMVHGKKNGLQRLMWLPREAAMQRLEGEGVKTFVVVRDPFARLVSAYQNKIATPWPSQRDDFWNKHLRIECPGMVEGRAMPTEGPLMTMVEFLRCLVATDAKGPSNEHWRPQVELCALDYISYDRYVHLETLAEEGEELLRFLGWNTNATAFSLQRNPVYSRDLADYFSEEALRLALEYYKEDFEVLGYPKVPRGKIDFYSVFDGTKYQPGFVPPADFQPSTNWETTTADNSAVDRPAAGRLS